MPTAARGRVALSLVDLLAERVEEAELLAPAFGLLAGIALTLSPLAWPSVPAVVGLVGPARAAARQGRPAAVSGKRGLAVVLGFVVGMDGVVAVLSASFLGVLVLLTRAAVVLTVLAVVLMTGVALRLLLSRQPLVCKRLDALPPDPLRAVSAGVVFAVSGCPGCTPVAAAVGAAAAGTGPLMSLVVVAAFIAGRALSLYAAAAVGARFLDASVASRARRLDVGLAVLHRLRRRRAAKVRR